MKELREQVKEILKAHGSDLDGAVKALVKLIEKESERKAILLISKTLARRGYGQFQKEAIETGRGS
ncbi:periplasmic binding protein (plasmid) [Thermovibrio ammonificans HB-1]|uniref:Periplasmic binding protein n=1 Tax=Thermovibrio ammonificans (strain DSM 15698 / JCM 12110 / HB-1) TaxID=648996 RepID=E8T710_THEA1|nr:hypothetical protein [Thermovibrio ammonificans]ADU97731.1 periplasmic binding protein [Thermovibrio ammonificans HB-1]